MGLRMLTPQGLFSLLPPALSPGTEFSGSLWGWEATPLTAWGDPVALGTAEPGSPLTQLLLLLLTPDAGMELPTSGDADFLSL